MEIKLDNVALEKIITDSLPKVLSEKLTCSYGNPIAVILDEEFKNMTGELRVFIKSILASVLTNPEFKIKIADIVLSKIVQQGLKS